MTERPTPEQARADFVAAVREGTAPARAFVVEHWLALTLATWAALLILAAVVQVTEGHGAEVVLVGCAAWFAPTVWRRLVG